MMRVSTGNNEAKELPVFVTAEVHGRKPFLKYRLNIFKDDAKARRHSARLAQYFAKCIPFCSTATKSDTLICSLEGRFGFHAAEIVIFSKVMPGENCERGRNHNLAYQLTEDKTELIGMVEPAEDQNDLDDLLIPTDDSYFVDMSMPAQDESDFVSLRYQHTLVELGSESEPGTEEGDVVSEDGEPGMKRGEIGMKRRESGVEWRESGAKKGEMNKDEEEPGMKRRKFGMEQGKPGLSEEGEVRMEDDALELGFSELRMEDDSEESNVERGVVGKQEMKEKRSSEEESSAQESEHKERRTRSE